MKPIYSRRNFLKACGSATTALCSDALRSATIKVAGPEVEYVLRGGQTYIDGRWCSCDIGITPRGRLVVSKSPIPCHYVINVSGRVVSPGFIDILADNSANPERTFPHIRKIQTGRRCRNSPANARRSNTCRRLLPSFQPGKTLRQLGCFH